MSKKAAAKAAATGLRATISREDLVRSLATARQVAPAKGSYPITANVLLSADEDGTSVSATDLTVHYRQHVGAVVESPGAVTVDARRLSEFVRELAADAVTITGHDNGSVEITAGRSRAKLAGLPATDFPAFAELDDDVVRWTADGWEIREAMGLTGYCMADDDVRPVLSGLLIAMHPSDGLSVTGTDGHRLSERLLPHIATSERRAIIPRPMIRVMSSLLSDEPVLVQVGQSMIGVSAQTWSVRGRLIDGQYPDTRGVLDGIATVVEAVVSRADLLSAVRRAAVVTSDRARGIRCTVTSESIAVSASTAELGEASEVIDCTRRAQTGAPEVSVGLNATYLAEALEAASATETIVIGIGGESSPVTITGVEGWRHVLMPMRL